MDAKQQYEARLERYVAAMRNETPDRIPIRPFVAEFTAKYAGFTCQEVTHDFTKAFEAVRKCAADFDWDAVVGNMVYVWTGLTQAIGLKYYAVPGIDLPPETPFQYKEPSETGAFMAADEYDQLIEDPTGFLFNVWLPRVSADVAEIGRPATFRNNLSFLKGGMAMLHYFNAFGPQTEQLRSEFGTVSAISGMLKAPLDILADKLRGYVGLSADLGTQPDRVRAACEALAPHLHHVALGGADPEKNLPIAMWMHRGCVPFISPKHFDTIFWPTLKPIIEALWAAGHQVLFYAEGDWTRHLETFAELDDRSIIFHVDRTAASEAKRILGHKFCLSGGIPNYLLTFGTPGEVRDCCKQLIDTLAPDGGYIMDASAIVQSDATVENMRVMTDFTREYGVYGARKASREDQNGREPNQSVSPPVSPHTAKRKPGVCIPWEEKRSELPMISGDTQLVQRVWEDTDALAYLYIWHCLLSF